MDICAAVFAIYSPEYGFHPILNTLYIKSFILLLSHIHMVYVQDSNDEIVGMCLFTRIECGLRLALPT